MADCFDPSCRDSLSSASGSGEPPLPASGGRVVWWWGQGAPSPPDRVAIGRSGWNVLHSFAGRFGTVGQSVKVPDDEQLKARSWLASFWDLYPCKVCRPGLWKAVAEDPPKTETREAFAVWMCELHNKVNRDLGLPVWPCVADKLVFSSGDRED